MAMGEEIHQYVESFGLERHDFTCTAQLPPVDVQFLSPKDDMHSVIS
jgi:hypothetical protein